jgi:uncharacterized protein YjdB
MTAALATLQSMAKFPSFLRKAAMVGLAVSALSLPVVGGTASAAPAGPAAPAATVKAPALSPSAKLLMRRDRNTVCVNGHVQNIGWQGWRCSSNRRAAMVGTVGRSLRLEAVSISTNRTGGVCAQGHVQNIGWQRTRCTSNNRVITVGTVGESLRLESVRLSTRTGICAQGHVQNIGWQNWRCSRRNGWVQVGTTDRSLSLEALRVRV